MHKRSINYIKPVCYYIRKCKSDKCVLPSYIVNVGRDGTRFTDDLNEAYEKIVFWRKNLFMLPTGKPGKKYIKEVTRLLNAWTQDTPLRSISLKAMQTMLILLSQKPSKMSKSRDRLDALERRLQLGKEVKLNFYY